MIYLFWGKDSFNIQLAQENIAKANKNVKSLDLNNPNLDDFVNSILTDSFFDKEKLLTVHGLIAQVIKDKKEKIFLDALGKITNDTSIIFLEYVEPKGIIKKYLLDKAKISHFDKPQGRDIINFIKKSVAEYETDISPLAAERLAGYVGADYWQLGEEIKKLVLYKKEDNIDQTIDVADVDELVRSGFEANIFELMDAISQKNTNRAISLLDSFLDSGENEIYILTMIARQFRNIAMAKLEKNINEFDLAKKAGIHPYVAKKSILQARNFTQEEILRTYEKILETDLALKSGQNVRQSLQSIILN